MKSENSVSVYPFFCLFEHKKAELSKNNSIKFSYLYIYVFKKEAESYYNFLTNPLTIAFAAEMCQILEDYSESESSRL